MKNQLMVMEVSMIKRTIINMNFKWMPNRILPLPNNLSTFANNQFTESPLPNYGLITHFIMKA